MDIDAVIAYHVATSVEFAERFNLAGIEPDAIKSRDCQRVIQFALKHVAEHRSAVGVDAVQSVIGVELQKTDVVFGFALDELYRRRKFTRIAETIEKATGLLRQNDPDAAFSALKQVVEQTPGRAGTVPARVTSLGKEVLESYQKVKDGYMGVPLPWPTMNELTMGLWPGTATYFVARPGTGKTQVATLIARNAWVNQYRVLIISPEMSRTEIAERFFLTQSKVSARDLVRGQLTTEQERKFRECIASISDEDGLYVMDSVDDLTVEGMEAAIQSLKPQLVAVDSIYMLRFKGDKSERTNAAVDWIRTASKRHAIPFVAFHQLSRMATKDKKHGGGYDSSAIALSDQLLWDAHAVFIMEQDSDMKADKRMKFNVAKIRRGDSSADPINCRWDFDAMLFDEVLQERKGEQFKDSDFDAFEVPF